MGNVTDITPILAENRRFDEMFDRPIVEVARELSTDDFRRFLEYHQRRS